MDKLLKALKGFSIIIACTLFIMTFMYKDCTTGDRIAFALFGCFILAFVYIPSFRNLLFTIFFFLLSITGLTLVLDNGAFVWSGAFMEVTFICAFILFFRKTFRNIHFRRSYHIDLSEVDNMTGLEFEYFTADLLSRLGYTRISVTKASGDQGIDVIAYKNGLSYAIQCKHYSGSLGNSAVQEAYAGKAYYGCLYAVVCTNSYFTAGAKELAASTGVLLWDRSILQDMLLQADASRFSHTYTSTPIEPDEDLYNKTTNETPRNDTVYTPAEVPPDCNTSIHGKKPTVQTKQEAHIDADFIAEAQWYASHGSVNLSEDD